MLWKFIVFTVRLYLKIIARMELINFDKIPTNGGTIVVTNHLGRLDAIIGAIITPRDDLIMMIAEKYQKYFVWRWVVKQLDAIWLNRFTTDFQAMRTVLKRLKQGGILALAPEGTRSAEEKLLPGLPGAAYLAAKTGAVLVPVALTGTEDRIVRHRLKRFQRLTITVHVGDPFTLPPMPRKGRDEYLQAQTDEIMCRIGALLPKHYHGHYAEHPRLLELLQANEK